jgi:hypothetical protein
MYVTIGRATCVAHDPHTYRPVCTGVGPAQLRCSEGAGGMTLCRRVVAAGGEDKLRLWKELEVGAEGMVVGGGGTVGGAEGDGAGEEVEVARSG